MAVWGYILLILSVLASGISVTFFKTDNRKLLKLLLAFSGSYLFAITVTHLIPEVYANHNSSIGIFILIGFFFQILLEFFSEGIEHGHIHIHKHEGETSFPLAMIISLSIHSFLEGMPLAQKFNEAGNTLLAGIVLHNIPVAFAFMSMLIGSGISKSKAYFFLILFAMMSPLGAFCSNFLSMSGAVIDVSFYFDRIMAIVIGIFLHISTTILFESSSDHRFNIYKMISIIMGAALVLLMI